MVPHEFQRPLPPSTSEWVNTFSGKAFSWPSFNAFFILAKATQALPLYLVPFLSGKREYIRLFHLMLPYHLPNFIKVGSQKKIKFFNGGR